MIRKEITAKASNMLCLLHGYQFLQPHSLQPTVRITIPFEEYVQFMSGQCDSSVKLSDTLFTLTDYSYAIRQYESGDASLLRVCYTLDCLRAGVQELKKAISRKGGATVILMNYSGCEEVNLCDTLYRLQTLWEKGSDEKYAFKQAMAEINKIGDATPIVLNDLTEHNQFYFAYLAYNYSACYLTEVGRKFEPINIK